MAARDLLAPSWRQLGERVGLLARAQVISPIAATLHERKAAFAQHVSAARAAMQQRAVANRRAKVSAVRAVYAAASINRLNADWVMGALSADLAIRGDLRALRDRARQLVRDNAMARRYQRLAIENIVGADGIAVEPQVLLPDGKTLDEETNRYLKARWLAWCATSAVDGRTWREVETLSAGVWKTEGEHLMALLPTRDNAFGFAVQLLDADQLDHEYNGIAPQTGNDIRLGVEVNAWMRPVAYWLWTAHPSEPVRGRRRIRVPAEQIVHLADFDRPNQTRGITPFANVLPAINHRGAMQEAILILQRTAASKMAFLEVDPEKAGAAFENDDGDDDGDANEPIVWDAEPGKIQQLPAGMSLKNWDPGQPTSEYDVFLKSVDRDAAVGLNVAYSSLTGNLADANFGSQRGGLLSERDGWRRDQQTMITRQHLPVYRAWLKYGILSGAIDLPFDLERYGRVHMQPRGFAWIDPEKDIEASLREVDAGLNTLTNIAYEKGRDFARMLEVRKREIELAKEAGVPINLNTKAAKPPAPGDSGATDESRPRLAAV
ncbi:MAG TPA: phage portal protein [Gemmatimonadaceae bacterium]